MGNDPWGFDQGRQDLARRLRAKRRAYSASHTALLLVYLAALLAGGSVILRRWVSSFALPGWAEATLFLAVLYIIGSALGWPFGYLGGYRLERRFGLSTQSRLSWALDLLKSFALGLAAVLVAGNVLLWLLRSFPSVWWLLAWTLGILVSVAIGFLAPVVLAPIFYRFKPLQDPALRSRFEALAAKAGVPVLGVFEMGASAKTRRSNAAVVGFGRTRRVIVTDTMLRAFTPDEVETVLAHELGHQRYHDPLIGLAVGASISLLMWSIAALAYAATFPAFGVSSLGDMAGLPLLVLYSGIVSTVVGPPELWWSRQREARADRFSLETTRMPQAFASAMVKLHDENLSVAHPKPWEKWLLYSHPPGRERVESARSFGRNGTSDA